MTKRERIERFGQQLRALFSAGRLVMRGPSAIIRQVRETERQLDRVARVMRETARPSDITNALAGVGSSYGDDETHRPTAAAAEAVFEQVARAARARGEPISAETLALFDQARSAAGVSWQDLARVVRTESVRGAHLRRLLEFDAGVRRSNEAAARMTERELVDSRREADGLARDILRRHGIDPGAPGGDRTGVVVWRGGNLWGDPTHAPNGSPLVVHAADEGEIRRGPDGRMVCVECDHSWDDHEIIEAPSLEAVGLASRTVYVQQVDQPVVARVCSAQVHEPDSGLLNGDEATNRFSCSICGHTWDAVELVQARDLAAIGIVSRPILVTEPDADECVVLDARAHVQAGELLRGATLQSIAEQTERAGFVRWETHLDPRTRHADTGRLRSSLSPADIERIRAGLPITISGPISGPAEAFDALARAAIGPGEEPGESSSAVAPPSRRLPPYRPT